MIYALVLLVVLVVAVALFFLWRKQQDAKKLAEAHRVFKIIKPVLERAPNGMMVAEVAAAAGLGRYEALPGLIMAVQVRAAYIKQSMNGMILETRYYPEFPVKEEAPVAPIGGAPGSSSGLPERWLAVRRDIVQTTALNDVGDILHPFYRCALCSREAATVVMLDGSLLADGEAYKRAVHGLRSEPQQWGAAGSQPCECGAHQSLVRTVVCRTNPTRGVDMHVSVPYGSRVPAVVSVLKADGSYEHLPESVTMELFGP